MSKEVKNDNKDNSRQNERVEMWMSIWEALKLLKDFRNSGMKSPGVEFKERGNQANVVFKTGKPKD